MEKIFRPTALTLLLIYFLTVTVIAVGQRENPDTSHDQGANAAGGANVGNGSRINLQQLMQRSRGMRLQAALRAAQSEQLSPPSSRAAPAAWRAAQPEQLSPPPTPPPSRAAPAAWRAAQPEQLSPPPTPPPRAAPELPLSLRAEEQSQPRRRKRQFKIRSPPPQRRSRSNSSEGQPSDSSSESEDNLSEIERRRRLNARHPSTEQGAQSRGLPRYPGDGAHGGPASSGDDSRQLPRASPPLRTLRSLDRENSDHSRSNILGAVGGFVSSGRESDINSQQMAAHGLTGPIPGEWRVNFNLPLAELNSQIIRLVQLEWQLDQKFVRDRKAWAETMQHVEASMEYHTKLINDKMTACFEALKPLQVRIQELIAELLRGNATADKQSLKRRIRVAKDDLMIGREECFDIQTKLQRQEDLIKLDAERLRRKVKTSADKLSSLSSVIDVLERQEMLADQREMLEKGKIYPEAQEGKERAIKRMGLRKKRFRRIVELEKNLQAYPAAKKMSNADVAAKEAIIAEINDLREQERQERKKEKQNNLPQVVKNFQGKLPQFKGQIRSQKLKEINFLQRFNSPNVKQLKSAYLFVMGIRQRKQTDYLPKEEECELLRSFLGESPSIPLDKSYQQLLNTLEDMYAADCQVAELMRPLEQRSRLNDRRLKDKEAKRLKDKDIKMVKGREHLMVQTETGFVAQRVDDPDASDSDASISIYESERRKRGDNPSMIRSPEWQQPRTLMDLRMLSTSETNGLNTGGSKVIPPAEGEGGLGKDGSVYIWRKGRWTGGKWRKSTLNEVIFGLYGQAIRVDPPPKYQRPPKIGLFRRMPSNRVRFFEESPDEDDQQSHR